MPIGSPCTGPGSVHCQGPRMRHTQHTPEGARRIPLHSSVEDSFEDFCIRLTFQVGACEHLLCLGGGDKRFVAVRQRRAVGRPTWSRKLHIRRPSVTTPANTPAEAIGGFGAKGSKCGDYDVCRVGRVQAEVPLPQGSQQVPLRCPASPRKPRRPRQAQR